MFAITVFRVQAEERVDIVFFARAATAPGMEDIVTRLHMEFPTPGFEVTVENQ